MQRGMNSQSSGLVIEARSSATRAGGCVLRALRRAGPLLRLRARFHRRVRARRDPGVARDVTAALGDALLDAKAAAGRQAAATIAASGVLARQLAIRVPGLLRA